MADSRAAICGRPEPNTRGYASCETTRSTARGRKQFERQGSRSVAVPLFIVDQRRDRARRKHDCDREWANHGQQFTQ